MARQLILMRHAKAAHGGEADHARPLTARGRRDALAAGALLRGRGRIPDLAVVSTAERTRQTWAQLCRGMRAEPQVWFDRALYEEGPAAVVEILAGVQPQAGTVLVVGHNPTISVVASALSDAAADERLEAALEDGLRTCALASFEVPVAWEDVNARRLRLVALDVPRG